MKKKKISESISVSTEQHNFFIENYCWVWIYVYLCVRTVPIDSNAIYDYFIRFHCIVGVSEYLMQIIHSIFFEILIQSNDGCMDMRFFRNKNDYIIVPKPHLIWRTLQSGNSKTGWHLISTILFFCSLARSLDSLALNFKAIWNMTWKKEPFQSYIQWAHLNLTRRHLVIWLDDQDFAKSQRVFISLIAFWINVCIGIEQIDYYGLWPSRAEKRQFLCAIHCITKI